MGTTRSTAEIIAKMEALCHKFAKSGDPSFMQEAKTLGWAIGMNEAEVDHMCKTIYDRYHARKVAA